LNISLQRVDDIYATADLSQQVMDQALQYYYAQAVVMIVLVFVVALICTFLTCCCGFIFSRTIIGPWKRLNDLQEKAVSLFVPKDLLAFLKISKISELRYGLAVQKELTVLRCDISNFNTITAKMKPDEKMTFFNAFLNSIGPIIRMHGGFIEKYMGNGFVAVMTSAKQGIKAALELHSYVHVFNKTFMQYPNIKVVYGVCSGNVIVGTIGEAQRMDVSIYSSITKTASKLAKLNLKYKTNILTLKDTVESTSSKTFSSRYIGKAKFTSEFDIYEILDGKDELKVNTLKDLSNAVEHMMRSELKEGMEKLQSVIAQNPKDATAEILYQLCTNMAQEKDVLGISLDLVLKNQTLREAFENFCKSELSYENILIWHAIEDYENAPDNKRCEIVNNLYRDYLDVDSKYWVNVNEQFKQQIALQLEQQDAIPAANLLEALKNEIEFVMLDSFKRFRKSDLLKQALQKQTMLGEKAE
jgi:class 3 adenylate cyclase